MGRVSANISLRLIANDYNFLMVLMLFLWKTARFLSQPPIPTNLIHYSSIPHFDRFVSQRKSLDLSLLQAYHADTYTLNTDEIPNVSRNFMFTLQLAPWSLHYFLPFLALRRLIPESPTSLFCFSVLSRFLYNLHCSNTDLHKNG